MAKKQDERNAKVAQLWKDGVSASDIAAQLSTPSRTVTRSSILGVVYRLRQQGVNLDGRPAQRRGSYATAAPKAPRAKSGAPPKPVPARPRPALREPVAIPTHREYITLSELAPTSCRWPKGDLVKDGEIRFCGLQTFTGPYCDGHRQLAYVPASGTRVDVKIARQRGLDVGMRVTRA